MCVFHMSVIVVGSVECEGGNRRVDVDADAQDSGKRCEVCLCHDGGIVYFFIFRVLL